MRRTDYLMATVLCVGLTGCSGSKKKPLIPVPAPPVQSLPFPEPAPPAPQPENTPVLPVEPIEPPPPPAAKPPATSRPRRTAPATPAPKPPAQAVPEPANPAPDNAPIRLGAILTPEQQEQYQAELKQSLAAARLSIGRTRGLTLNSAQRETTARIQTFIQQAETMTGSDLATAAQLARRAELLGDDLVKSLR